MDNKTVNKPFARISTRVAVWSNYAVSKLSYSRSSTFLHLSAKNAIMRMTIDIINNIAALKPAENSAPKTPMTSCSAAKPLSAPPQAASNPTSAPPTILPFSAWPHCAGPKPSAIPAQNWSGCRCRRSAKKNSCWPTAMYWSGKIPTRAVTD